ncbi:MAG: hypothetical protein DRQ46_00405 [Gammaproteobacteria bacterium]|nr:MAG: hypothetical protein DRQ46_00405 [Gammaproteobacteria bacterium]
MTILKSKLSQIAKNCHKIVILVRLLIVRFRSNDKFASFYDKNDKPTFKIVIGQVVAAQHYKKSAMTNFICT